MGMSKRWVRLVTCMDPCIAFARVLAVSGDQA